MVKSAWKELNLLERVIKCVQFLPYIWKDEDYNFESFLPVMKLKLQRLEKCMNEKLNTSSTILDYSLKKRDDVAIALYYIENIINYSERYAYIYSEECPVKYNGKVWVNISTNTPATDKEWEERTKWVIKCRKFKNEQITKLYELLRDNSNDWWSDCDEKL